MTEVTIGRFGQSFDVDANQWDVAGAQVRASGYIGNASRDLIALARQQINGLVELDERVVPVTFASDSSQDGFYRVDDASVGMDVNRYAAKSLPWSASLTRVPNFARPMIELRSLGKVRSNVDSFTSGNITPTVAIPTPVTAATGQSSALSSTYATASGPVYHLSYASLTNAVSSFQTLPGDFYDGAATVEQLIGGTWYPIVGRATNAAPTAIRVNNGLLRVTGYTAGTASESGLTVAGWNGTAWGTDKPINFRRSGSTLVVDGPQSVEIVRNRPEEVKVKYTYPAYNGTVRTILEVYVRLRRGWRMADVSMNLPDGITAQWAVKGTEALTAQTGGYHATSDDADGQRVLVAVRSSTSLADTNTSVVYGSASDGPVVFGLGVRITEINTWGSTSDAMARWFADLATSQTINAQ